MRKRSSERSKSVSAGEENYSTALLGRRASQRELKPGCLSFGTNKLILAASESVKTRRITRAVERAAESNKNWRNSDVKLDRLQTINKSALWAALIVHELLFLGTCMVCAYKIVENILRTFFPTVAIEIDNLSTFASLLLLLKIGTNFARNFSYLKYKLWCFICISAW